MIDRTMIACCPSGWALSLAAARSITGPAGFGRGAGVDARLDESNSRTLRGRADVPGAPAPEGVWSADATGHADEAHGNPGTTGAQTQASRRSHIRSSRISCAALAIERANQVRAMDISYIPMRRGLVYLVAVVDSASHRVLAHRVSITMEAGFCVEALEEATR